MLRAVVKGTDWSQLTEYLSPVFFQIVPPIGMAQKLKSMVSGYMSPSKFQEIAARVNGALENSPLNVRIDNLNRVGMKVEIPAPGPEIKPGDVLLRLYFWQIFALDEALLDFRSKAFPQPQNVNAWHPSPLFTRWDPKFISAARNLYLGFYTDRTDLMDDALAHLGLTAGKSVLLKHFGENQDRVRFEMASFRATFHEVFLACKQARSRMHPDFLALGGMLACLYEHLEQLGGTYNVRQAFADVCGSIK